MHTTYERQDKSAPGESLARTFTAALENPAAHGERDALGDLKEAAEILYARLLREPAEAAAVAACVRNWKRQPDWARQAAETLFNAGLLFSLEAETRAFRAGSAKKA